MDRNPAPAETAAVPSPNTDRPSEGRSTGELLKELSSGTGKLVRQEVELAKAELRVGAEQGKRAAVWLSLAATPALIGVVLIAMGILEALAQWLPRWAAAFLGAAGALAVAAALAALAVRRIKAAQGPARMEQTVQTLKEDKAWIKDRLR